MGTKRSKAMKPGVAVTLLGPGGILILDSSGDTGLNSKVVLSTSGETADFGGRGKKWD